ncbi:MAG: hypothetical protein HGA85_04605 [Nanoarchaeota archaeon]|nr:hypothetical protein [Nanoarchaeota archaeon]
MTFIYTAVAKDGTIVTVGDTAVTNGYGLVTSNVKKTQGAKSTQFSFAGNHYFEDFERFAHEFIVPSAQPKEKIAALFVRERERNYMLDNSDGSAERFSPYQFMSGVWDGKDSILLVNDRVGQRIPFNKKMYSIGMRTDIAAAYLSQYDPNMEREDIIRLLCSTMIAEKKSARIHGYNHFGPLGFQLSVLDQAGFRNLEYMCEEQVMKKADKLPIFESKYLQ